MKISDWLVLSCCLIAVKTTENDCKEKKLTRVRRYLAFPEGAVFSVSIICFQVWRSLDAGINVFSIPHHWPNSINN